MSGKYMKGKRLLLLMMSVVSLSAGFETHAIEFNEIPQVQRDILLSRFGNTTIKVLDFETLSKFDFWGVQQRGQMLFFSYKGIEQVIVPANSFDQSAITLSQIATNPREVGVFLALTRQGEILFHPTSPFFSSGRQDQITLETSNQEADRFFSWLQDTGKFGDVSYVEFIHSHPKYDAYSDKRGLIAPLSSHDLKMGSLLSNQLGGLPVMVSSTVPNGYTYRALLKGGQNITFQASKKTEN